MPGRPAIRDGQAFNLRSLAAHNYGFTQLSRLRLRKSKRRCRCPVTVQSCKSLAG